MTRLKQTNGRDIVAGLQYCLNLVIVATLVAVTAWAAMTYTAGSQRVPAIWPANGLVLAFLITSTHRHWIGYMIAGFIGNVLANFFFGDFAPLAFGTALCNSIEIAIAALAFARSTRLNPDLTHRRVMIQFISSAIIIAPAISAFLGSLLLTFQGDYSFFRAAEIWFLANAIGMAIVTPLALCIRRYSLSQLLTHEKISETLLLMTVLGALTVVIFDQSHYPFLFMVFPPLVYVVFRLGFPGLTVAIGMIAVLSIGFTIAGHGPFMMIHDVSTYKRLLVLQNFILTTLLVSVPLAIVLAERTRMHAELGKLRKRLKGLSATDNITGLADRATLDDVVQTAWLEALPAGGAISLILARPDGFEAYCTRYGQATGNAWLAAMAKIIDNSTWRSLDLAARYDNDRLALLLPETDADGAKAVMTRIRSNLARLHIPDADSQTGDISVHMGLASIAAVEGLSPDMLFSAAELALTETMI